MNRKREMDLLGFLNYKEGKQGEICSLLWLDPFHFVHYGEQRQNKYVVGVRYNADWFK